MLLNNKQMSFNTLNIDLKDGSPPRILNSNSSNVLQLPEIRNRFAFGRDSIGGASGVDLRTEISAISEKQHNMDSVGSLHDVGKSLR